eukprot:278782-Chlamydomonas_euryale.AAC.3
MSVNLLGLASRAVALAARCGPPPLTHPSAFNLGPATPSSARLASRAHLGSCARATSYHGAPGRGEARAGSAGRAALVRHGRAEQGQRVAGGIAGLR